MFEYETVVVGSFADYIERSAFAFSDFANLFDVLFFHHETHAFLALVADDFFSRESWVADRELIHVDLTTGSFYEFRKCIEVTACTVVVDTYARVVVHFSECTHDVADTLLHFRVGTLHSVKLDRVVVLTCSH